MSQHNQQQQNPQRDQGGRKPEEMKAAPEAPKWKPDKNTLILIPDEAAYLQPAQAAIRARFGQHQGHIETTIDVLTWVHRDTTILVVPLRDKLPGEDPRPYRDPTGQMVDLRQFAGFLECEPIHVGAHDGKGSLAYWREGKHAKDGTVKLKGDDGLLSALNRSVIAGLRRLEDGTLEPGTPQGRVTMRLEHSKDRTTVTQCTLQLSST